MYNKHSVILPSLACSLILGVATLFFVFNDSIWPVFLLIGTFIGIVGLIASTRNHIDAALKHDRWKVSTFALLSNMLLYVIAAVAVGGNDESGLTSLALMVMFFFMIPFYFGAANLLAIMLVPRKTNTY
jgi:uncharacterized membrane protein YqgA involved in biofilm formation